MGNTEETKASDEDAIVAAGAVRVPFKDKDALRAMVPDMYQAWLDRQTNEGRGESAAVVVNYAREIDPN